MRPFKEFDRLQIPPAEIVASAMRRRGVASVLEVGCGVGGIISQFQGVPLRMGVDINEVELQQAMDTHHNIVFERVDITRLLDRFQPRSFDAVFASDVLEHFEKDVSNDVLRQMEEVAALYVAVWSPMGPEGMDDFNRTCVEQGEPICHLCVITEEEFADRGYMTMTFPSYWSRYYREEWTAHGLLAIKEMGR
jgi:SAM-dependent methyltransferase